MNTKIEWCRNADGTPGITWNPVTGCTPCSPGCEHCYAKTMSVRLKKMGIKKYENGFSVTCHENIPLPKFKKPQTIFVCSMSDLFHVNVPFEFIRRVFVDIWAALLDPIGKPGLNHRFIIFTKRPERMLEFWNWHRVRYSIYPNDCCVSDHDVVPDKRIWIGVTCENQHCADRRIPALLQIPAAVHLVSYEPALGPLDLTKVKWAKIPVDPEYYKQLGVPAPSEMWSLNDVLWSRPADKLNKAKIGLDWVIMGAENGTHRRFMSIEWARDMAHQCQSAEVPLFYKQGPDDCGNHFRKMPMLYGRTWDQMPEIKS